MCKTKVIAGMLILIALLGLVAEWHFDGGVWKCFEGIVPGMEMVG